MMKGLVLVPIKGSHGIEEIVRYLQGIAEPGMKVVFLIPYPVEAWLYLKDYWVTTESPSRAMLEGRRIQERYSWELQRGLAEQKVSAVREALSRLGVDVTVELYTGSLKRVLADYAANVQLIIAQVGSSHPILWLVRRIMRFSVLFRQSGFPSVLVLDGERGTGICNRISFLDPLSYCPLRGREQIPRLS